MPAPRAQSILDDYKFHTMLIHRFVDGISHEESLLQLPFKHNCMNWILGHIVTNRSHVLETLGVTHSWQDEVRSHYHTGTPNVTSDNNSVQFDMLAVYLDESIPLLQSALDNMTDSELDETHSNYRGEKSRYDHATGFHWHEDFHIGQLEILQSFIESERENSA